MTPAGSDDAGQELWPARWVPPKPALCLVALVALANAWFVDYIADDAFIVLRYIRNLEAGHGLVYNVGERVEGYSTFLWLALLAVAHQVLPFVSLPALARAGGVVAAVVVVVLLPLRTPPSGMNRVMLLAAALLVAADASFAAWAAAGLETPLFTLLVTAGALCTVRLLDGGAPTIWPAIWFGLASLTRPDGPLFFVVALALVLAVEWLRGTLRLRTLLLWLVPFLALVVPHLLWRHWYYGAWVPNTALAKVPAGLDHFRDGFTYVRNFTRERNTLVWMPLVAVLLVRRRPAWLVYLIATIGAQLAYVMFVGGDSLGFYRFLVPVMPMMYMVSVAALDETARASALLRVPVAVRRLLVGVGVASMVWLAFRPGVAPLWFPAEVRWHDSQSDLWFPGDGTVHRYRWYGNYFVDRLTIAASYLDTNTPKGAVVASTPAGAIGYYLDRPLIDMLGLNDRHIAMSPGVYQGEDARVGHEKGDGRYVLDRAPDIVLLGNVALLPEPLDEGEMAERLVMKSEHELWADPMFHARYERVTVKLADSGPFQYFTFYRRRPVGG